MGNLRLITTETFGNVDCNFYRNMNDDILLTREQIGTALEYSNPRKAINKIHSRHKGRLGDLSFVSKLTTTDDKQYNTMLYTERGVMEICRWSRQPKANQFMDWAWDVIDKYRRNELQPQINMTPITEMVASLTKSISTLTTNITEMQQDIQDLKYSQKNQFVTEQRYPSAWYKRMSPKFKMLEEYFNCKRRELYANLYKELEDTYNVDISQIHEDYCYKNHLRKDECYPMDAIEHNDRLRNALGALVNDTLVRCGLSTEDEARNFKRHTIFDDIPKAI